MEISSFRTAVFFGLLVLLLDLNSVVCTSCSDRCQNGGTCVPSERGSMCLCPQGFSGSKCEIRSKYAPLVFVCDEEAGVILESTADYLDFSPLPIDNLYRPVAVSYSPEQDMIFWIDAANDTLNRAFRNGSGHVTIESSFEDFSDLTFSRQSQLLTYIANGRYLDFQQINSSRASVNRTHDSDLTTICLHPNSDLYAFENGTIPNLYRYESNMASDRIPKPSLLSPRTMAFDRHGSRLFMLDDMKETLESCGPLGEDQQILLHYQNTKPVDVEWYQGTAFWSDSSSHSGIGFMAKRGGPSTGIASLQQFQTARGIYVYHGDSYARQAGEDCLEDEFTCNNTVCIPVSWRCDGLVDCEHGLDEADCLSDEPDSLVFVTDLNLKAIFMATATNLSFTQLPLTGLDVPVAVDYDPVDNIVYWTDVGTSTINSAQIDGTNQQTVISGLGTPDGLYFDGQTKTIYWTDAFYQTIDAFYPNGTGRVNLLSNLDNPRGIIIVSTTTNRLLYWTEWGNFPKIEMSDLNGQNRRVIIDTDLVWPNGITQDREGSRLYWCDAYLDKIESSDIYGGDRKLLIDHSHTGIHPFGVVFHYGTLMWTDWDFDGIGVIEGSPYAWPKRYILPGGFERPGAFRIFEVETSSTTSTTNTTTTTTTESSTTTPLTTTTMETSVTNGTATSPTTTTETSTITRSTTDMTEGIDTRDPMRVTSSPLSLTVNPLDSVEMMCSFENAIRFEWQKDNASIPRTENENIYTITSMTPSHIGYYRCRGEGINENGAPDVVFTDQAALYITDLSNIIIEDARFNINVTSPGDLSDSSSQYYQDAAETITNYVQAGMMTTGQFEVNSLFVVPSNLREGSIIANLNMYILDNGTSPSQIRQDVETSFFALSHQDGILDTSAVRVISTSICPRLTTRSRFGEVQFGEGDINTWSNSTGRDCPFNTTNANQPVATAQCVGDRISPAVWKPQDNCGVFRNVTELLREIDEEVEITEDTVEEVTEHVSVITQNTEEITSSDITLVSIIATEIAAQNTSGKEVTAKVTNIVSNIASVDMAELQAAEESNNAISNMLIAYETQLNNVEVAEDEPFDVAEENLAVQVRSVPQDELGQGLVLSLSGDSSSDLSRSNITVRAGDDTPVEEERVGLIAEVSIPPEIAVIASGALSGKANDTNINIIMSVFATPVLFFTPSLLNFSRENEDVNRTANTPVILLSVGGVVIENLNQTINLTFTALEPGYENQTCVFWEENNSEWSSEGCRLVESRSSTSVLSDDSPNASEGNGSDSLSNNTIKETYTCACDHLTNFAILMDIHNRTTEFTYNVLSYIGCTISIVCLLISLGTYLMNKKLRSRQSHQIFICLCATMLCLYISFLATIVLDTVRGASEVHPGACAFLAALIHFFALSSISWMGVEGFNTYLVIVRIFNTYIPNFMIKAGLAAWGIPAIIVILTGGVANVNYAEEHVCFLRAWSQIGGLLIPMAVVLLANVVIFILVIRQLSKSSKVSGKVKKGKEHERQETIERIKNAVTILVLLGLTWITGYLLLIEAFTQVAQAVFILLNCFQGLFMFILYCLRKPVVRQQWGLTCSWCDRDDGKRGARLFSSTSLSDSVKSLSRVFNRKNDRKYSIGESIIDPSKDGQSTGSISNPADDDLVSGNYTPCDDESRI